MSFTPLARRPTLALLIGGVSALSFAFSAPALAQMSSPTNDPTAKPPPVTPGGPPAPTPSRDMAAVLDAQTALGAKAIENLIPAEARKQPTVADGAMQVMKRMGMSTAPDPSVTTRDVSYPAGGGALMARIYHPAGMGRMSPGRMGKGPMPVVLYYHGGGWVIADVKTYDSTPRALSKALNAIVVSVEYRHAPEYRFPAQHEDAAAAYRWVLANAKSWGGDPMKVALAGESAGGNLAVATAIYARDHQLTPPVHVLAVYPIANSDTTLPSKTEQYNQKPLNTPMLTWFGYYWSKSPADMQDPRINLVAANLSGLPTTTIVLAQNDPLRSDGETLAQAMQAAGDSVDLRTFPGVTHEFFGTAKVVRGAADANAYAVGRLQASFGMASMR